MNMGRETICLLAAQIPRYNPCRMFRSRQRYPVTNVTMNPKRTEIEDAIYYTSALRIIRAVLFCLVFMWTVSSILLTAQQPDSDEEDQLRFRFVGPKLVIVSLRSQEFPATQLPTTPEPRRAGE